MNGTARAPTLPGLAPPLHNEPAVAEPVSSAPLVVPAMIQEGVTSMESLSKSIGGTGRRRGCRCCLSGRCAIVLASNRVSR